MDNHNGDIIIYKTEEGLTKIDVKFEGETVWLSQQQMAELFSTSRTNIKGKRRRKIKMKYKYIFFDWGYTLISKFENVDDKINDILKKYNLKWDEIFRKWKNYQLLNSLGKVSQSEIYEDLSLILKISKEDLEKIDMLLLESHILEKETKNTIGELYKRGYYLGIISNNSIRNVEYILKRENIKKYFKKIVISEAVKERKPNLKVYIKAFEDIPEDEYKKVAFVSDELLEDLLGVKILGVNTIWYEQDVNNQWKKKEDVLIEPDYIIKSMKELLNIV